MSQKKTVSILGCGWLGLALAKRLIALGCEVKGSVRDVAAQDQLRDAGVDPWLIDLNVEEVLLKNADFFDADYLVISIPPGRKPEVVAGYSDLILSLAEPINRHRIKGVVFLSSTSVYPVDGNRVDELCCDAPDKPVGHAILAAEMKLKESLKVPLTILRLAGLIGADRMPQNYLKNKKKILMSEGPTNLIHRDDCLRVIEKVLELNLWQQTMNVCCDEHPSRKEYYQAAAMKFGFPLPPFEQSALAPFKIVENKLLKELLGDKILSVPDPLSLFD